MVIKIKIITIYIPDIYKTIFDILIEKGVIPSKSKALREAIKDFLNKEILFNKSLKNFKVDNNKLPSVQQIVGTQKKHIKPEKIYVVFKHDMNKNYIISFLKQIKKNWLYKHELCELMNCSSQLISNLMTDITNVHPELIIISATPTGRKGNNYRIYKLNNEKLNEIMEGKKIL